MICEGYVTGGAAGRRSQFAVLIVSDMHNLRYRAGSLQNTLFTSMQIYFLYETLNGLRGKGSQTVFRLFENSEYYSTSIIVPPPTKVSPSYSTSA